MVSSFFLCCQITASEVVIIVVVVTVAVCVQAGDFCHWAECILLLLLRGATPIPWCPEVPTRGPRFTWSTSSKSSISSSSSSSKGSTVTKEEFLAFFKNFQKKPWNNPFSALFLWRPRVTQRVWYVQPYHMIRFNVKTTSVISGLHAVISGF